jgi:hypothetical protein
MALSLWFIILSVSQAVPDNVDIANINIFSEDDLDNLTPEELRDRLSYNGMGRDSEREEMRNMSPQQARERLVAFYELYKMPEKLVDSELDATIEAHKGDYESMINDLYVR